MQTTIYYNNEDAYLMGQVDAKGRRERKSRSAVLLSILEDYFESDKRLGEILVDLEVISHANLCKGLDLQKSKFADKLLGDILLEEELVTPEAVERALLIQDRQREGATRVYRTTPNNTSSNSPTALNNAVGQSGDAS